MIPRETKRPRDYEVMNMVLERGDAVEAARRLSVSPQLVRSWCRPPETEDEYATGKFGPLARLRTIISMIAEDDGSSDRAVPIAQYIANLCGGVFVPLPPTSKQPDSDLMAEFSNILKETGEAIEAARKAWFENTPGMITEKELGDCSAEIKEAVVAILQFERWIESMSNLAPTHRK